MQRYAYSIIVLLALSGCLQSPPSDEEFSFSFPDSVTGEPVATTDKADPVGQWYAEQAVSGATVWFNSMAELPGEAQWVVEWTPDRPGGYIIISGVIVEPVRGDGAGGGYLHMADADAWARPSEPTSYQGIVQTTSAEGTGEWYLLFAVQAIEASGSLRVLIQWDGGPVQDWEPLVRNVDAAVQSDEHQLVHGEELDVGLDMSGFEALHVVMPCQWDGVDRTERFRVEVGRAKPDLYRFEGTRDYHERINWGTHVGFWTYRPESATVSLLYEGDTPPLVAVVRTDFDLSTLLETRSGYPVWASSTAGQCMRLVTP